MIFFLLQQALGDEHGHRHVFVAGGLELPVQLLLHIFPDGVAIGAVDEHALDAGIVNELRLLAHIGKPLCKINVPGGDGVHLSLILCHKSFVSFSRYWSIFRSKIRSMERMPPWLVNSRGT